MILQKNMFVEAVLPGSIIRELTGEEMAEYRRPFQESGEARRPTLTWPRQIPIGGEPADVTEIVADYAAWLPGTDFPKLFINAEPGALIQGELRDAIRDLMDGGAPLSPAVAKHLLSRFSPGDTALSATTPAPFCTQR